MHVSRQAVAELIFLMVTVPVLAGGSADGYHVMVTNDDGIGAPGLAAMVAALAADPAYRVTVVAPAAQQSVASQSHITRREVAVRAHAPIAGVTSWSVDGSPATAARLGVATLLADDPPDLVVSGINRGENDGLGAWTSGTVGAAREALIAGVPSIAFSLALDWDNPRPDFESAASWCKPVVDLVRRRGLPHGVLLNVNVPRDPATIRGYRLATMSLAPPAVARYDLVREDEDARWYRSRWRPPADADGGSDTRALHEGWVAIAPLGLDQTDRTAWSLIRELEAELSPVEAAVSGAN